NEIISSVRTYDRTLPSFSASYKQPLHIFIRNQKWRSWKKNNISYTSSKNSFSRDIQNLEVEARSLYFDTLVTLSKTEVERQKLKSSKILLSITQALVEAGKTAPVELTRAQINYKLDERRVRNAEIATQQTLNSFKNLVLIPETQEVKLTSKLQYVPQQLSLKALQDYAIAHRLDLQNSQMNVTLSEIGLKETKETNRPQLATNASYKYDTQVTGDRPESWDVSASMDWNFFDSRINALRIKEKVLSLENTRRQLDSLRRQILVEVQNGYLEFVRTDEQIADFAETRKQAENNLSAVRLRYERGLDRLIDVFDAESKLRDLDLEYLSLLVSYNKSVDKLGILIGAKLEEAFK
ncbi:MAG: TolC family protein, partial [Elusimicrobia bacterium]|nr:TolC family protein [Elusimicrobiota bacterium]